jgi:hypothetical protein
MTQEELNEFEKAKVEIDYMIYGTGAYLAKDNGKIIHVPFHELVLLIKEYKK